MVNFPNFTPEQLEERRKEHEAEVAALKEQIKALNYPVENPCIECALYTEYELAYYGNTSTTERVCGLKHLSDAKLDDVTGEINFLNYGSHSSASSMRKHICQGQYFIRKYQPFQKVASND